MLCCISSIAACRHNEIARHTYLGRVCDGNGHSIGTAAKGDSNLLDSSRVDTYLYSFAVDIYPDFVHAARYNHASMTSKSSLSAGVLFYITPERCEDRVQPVQGRGGNSALGG